MCPDAPVTKTRMIVLSVVAAPASATAFTLGGGAGRHYCDALK